MVLLLLLMLLVLLSPLLQLLFPRLIHIVVVLNDMCGKMCVCFVSFQQTRWYDLVLIGKRRLVREGKEGGLAACLTSLCGGWICSVVGWCVWSGFGNPIVLTRQDWNNTTALENICKSFWMLVDIRLKSSRQVNQTFCKAKWGKHVYDFTEWAKLTISLNILHIFTEQSSVHFIWRVFPYQFVKCSIFLTNKNWATLLYDDISSHYCNANVRHTHTVT